MSNIDFRLITPDGDSQNQPAEYIRLTGHGLSGFLRTFTGLQGAYYVSLVPSLNVSGYGMTEEIAIESLKENLITFFDDIFGVAEIERHKELARLGWQRKLYFKKQLVNKQVDEKGVRQSFDFPEKVKTSILRAA